MMHPEAADSARDVATHAAETLGFPFVLVGSEGTVIRIRSEAELQAFCRGVGRLRSYVRWAVRPDAAEETT